MQVVDKMAQRHRLATLGRDHPSRRLRQSCRGGIWKLPDGEEHPRKPNWYEIAIILAREAAGPM